MTVAERVRRVLCKELFLRRDRLIMDSDGLQGDLGADELDQVEIIVALEEEFNINIPSEDAEVLDEVGKIVRYIENKIKG